VALGATGPTTVATLDAGGRMSLGAGIGDSIAADGVPGYNHGLTFWTRGFGSWGELDGNGNAATAQRNLGGFVSGVDAGVGGGWRAGLATGYIQSNINVGARSSSADINSYILAGYAGGAAGPIAIRSGAAWTWHGVDSTRNVVFPGFFEAQSASYNADTGQLFAEIAYPLLNRQVAIEPFAGLAYVHVDTDSFGESGPTAGLTSGGSDQNIGYSTLGLRAATTLPMAGVLVTPHGSLAWQYAFGDVTPEQAVAFASTGIAFGTAGVPIAQSSALIEAGLDFALGPDAIFGISYAGQLAGDLQDNGVQGRLNWRY
jgi:outer membrane autotransporter protein